MLDSDGDSQTSNNQDQDQDQLITGTIPPSMFKPSHGQEDYQDKQMAMGHAAGLSFKLSPVNKDLHQSNFQQHNNSSGNQLCLDGVRNNSGQH
jgi:hypothetical protein